MYANFFAFTGIFKCSVVIASVTTLVCIMYFITCGTPQRNFENARFAVAYHYYEQQTNAVLNMWTMQKWAKLMGFKVLEPFAHDSILGFPNKVLERCNSYVSVTILIWIFGQTNQRKNMEFHHLRSGMHLFCLQ